MGLGARSFELTKAKKTKLEKTMFSKAKRMARGYVSPRVNPDKINLEPKLLGLPGAYGFLGFMAAVGAAIMKWPLGWY